MATGNLDESQWHTVTCGEHTYTVPVRYQDRSPIGQGPFRNLVRAKDTVTGKYVAIQKVGPRFIIPADAKRTYRELKLLTHLNHPDAQIVQLYNVFTPEKNLNDFQTLYFVFNYIDYDLHRVIQRDLPFSEEHIRLIIYSLLRGLKFIHSAGIILRDLKPSNIGVDQNFNVTILDFDSALVPSGNFAPEYVCRWWHAPELIDDWKRHDDKLDIWSVGCIMAELILLRPLFRGTDCIDQLIKIFDIIGTPDLDTLNAVCTQEARIFIIKMQPRPKQDFNQLFGFKYDPETQAVISGVSPEGIDLLERLLSFDHRLRPTVEQALGHPFLEEFHDPMDEPSIQPMVDEHQDAVYSTTQWKSLIWQLIQDFVPPSWVNEDLADDS